MFEPLLVTSIFKLKHLIWTVIFVIRVEDGGSHHHTMGRDLPCTSFCSIPLRTSHFYTITCQLHSCYPLKNDRCVSKLGMLRSLEVFWLTGFRIYSSSMSLTALGLGHFGCWISQERKWSISHPAQHPQPNTCLLVKKNLSDCLFKAWTLTAGSPQIRKWQLNQLPPTQSSPQMCLPGHAHLNLEKLNAIASNIAVSVVQELAPGCFWSSSFKECKTCWIAGVGPTKGLGPFKEKRLKSIERWYSAEDTGNTLVSISKGFIDPSKKFKNLLDLLVIGCYRHPQNLHFTSILPGPNDHSKHWLAKQHNGLCALDAGKCIDTVCIDFTWFYLSRVCRQVIQSKAQAPPLLHRGATPKSCWNAGHAMAFAKLGGPKELQ